MWVHVNATDKKELDKIIHQICHVNRNDKKKFWGLFFFFKQYYYSLSDFLFGLPLPLLAFGVDLLPDF